jgi:hypothetical protein
VISVCHFPPGTSKWNKIEQKSFSQISLNWKGIPISRLPNSGSIKSELLKYPIQAYRYHQRQQVSAFRISTGSMGGIKDEKLVLQGEV